MVNNNIIDEQTVKVELILALSKYEEKTWDVINVEVEKIRNKYNLEDTKLFNNVNFTELL